MGNIESMIKYYEKTMILAEKDTDHMDVFDNIDYNNLFTNVKKMINNELKDESIRREHEPLIEGKITTWSSNNNRSGVFLKTLGKVKPEYQNIVLLMQFVARYICYSLERSKSRDPKNPKDKDFNEVCSEVLSQSILAGGMEGFLERLEQFTDDEERKALNEFITADIKTKLASLKVTQDRLLGLSK